MKCEEHHSMERKKKKKRKSFPKENNTSYCQQPIAPNAKMRKPQSKQGCPVISLHRLTLKWSKNPSALHKRKILKKTEKKGKNNHLSLPHSKFVLFFID